MTSTGTKEILSGAFLDRLCLPGVALIATSAHFGRAFAYYDNHNLGP